MVDLAIFLALLCLGFFVGRFNERRHFASIVRREEDLRDIRVFATRDAPPCESGALVSGNVVVSIDYFKRLIAFLVGLLGGQIRAYETLVERGRREAILRMKQEAQGRGASDIVNVKLMTSRVFYSDRNVGSIEVLAYGTAIRGASLNP